MVTLAGTAQYPWVLRQSGTVGTADVYCGVLRALRVLWMNVGTAQYPWVLQGTVGTVGTARGNSDSWVLRQYPWVLWVLWVLYGLK